MRYSIMSGAEYLKKLNGEVYKTIDSEGNTCYRKNGVYHRDDDKPAIINSDNLYRAWFKNGNLHRENNKPAILIREIYDKDIWDIYGVNIIKTEKESKYIAYYFKNGIYSNTVGHKSNEIPPNITKRLDVMFKLEDLY